MLGTVSTYTRNFYVSCTYLVLALFLINCYYVISYYTTCSNSVPIIEVLAYIAVVLRTHTHIL